MPLLRITTNQVIASETQLDILKKLSAEIAEVLKKSEDYVMTAWPTEATMTFAGQAQPSAFVELDSIGINPEQAHSLSQIICKTLSECTDIASSAIYIKFYDSPRALWGWDGKTFA